MTQWEVCSWRAQDGAYVLTISKISVVYRWSVSHPPSFTRAEGGARNLPSAQCAAKRALAKMKAGGEQ